MDMINGECPLHHVALVRGPVPIQYGLRYLSNEYRAARNKLFPRAVSFMNGGCCVSKDSPRTMYVHYCEQCRAAEKEWNEANPEDPLRALKERFNIPTDPSQRLTGLDLEWTLHKMERGHLHPDSPNPDSPSQGAQDQNTPNPDAPSQDAPNPDSPNPDLPSGRNN